MNTLLNIYRTGTAKPNKTGKYLLEKRQAFSPMIQMMLSKTTIIEQIHLLKEKSLPSAVRHSVKNVDALLADELIEFRRFDHVYSKQ